MPTRPDGSDRRHRRITAGLVACTLGLAVAGCATSGGDEDGVAAATEATAEADTGAAADESTVVDTSLDAALDGSFVHDISVTFDEADYQELLDAYAERGEKVWIEATVTIDGATYERVGLRLKGNSSLRGVAEGDSAPEELPWLLRFDEFVDGQDHEGLYDLVIRSNGSETSINEAVALELLDLAGLASQDAMATRFSVNGSATVLRLSIEHPDDPWMEDAFGGGGALYKAESAGDFSYRGEDPDAYDEVFDQEAGKADHDLTPLIDFLQFINEADDETFAVELADHLDIDGFATYLAMMELLGNTDDIDGPGNNSYLYYDAETDRMTVVPWDLNLALGVGMGGGRTGGMAPLGGMDRGDGAPVDRPLPQGQPEGGGDLPPGGGPAGGGGGFRGPSNVLVERFLAVEEFDARYQQALADLSVELFDSGTADRVLAEWVAVLQAGATDLVDQETIAAEAGRIASQLDQ